VQRSEAGWAPVVAGTPVVVSVAVPLTGTEGVGDPEVAGCDASVDGGVVGGAVALGDEDKDEEGDEDDALVLPPSPQPAAARASKVTAAAASGSARRRCTGRRSTGAAGPDVDGVLTCSGVGRISFECSACGRFEPPASRLPPYPHIRRMRPTGLVCPSG